MVCQRVSCCWLSDKRRPRTERDGRYRLMQHVSVKRLMVLTDENDDSYKEALNGKTHLDIPERSLKIVLVSLPDTPPGEIEKQVNIKKELPVFFQKLFQSISPQSHPGLWDQWRQRVDEPYQFRYIHQIRCGYMR